MEEINAKLSSGSSVVLAQVISKLLQNLKNKKCSDLLETMEYKFLKDKCISNNSALSVVSSEAVIQIACMDPLLVKPIIADFVSVISTTKCSPNVAFLLNNLLLMDIKNELSKENNYKCPFNMKLPQHPFLILLNENSESWINIYNEIIDSCRTLDDRTMSHYNMMLKPIFLYTLCRPHRGILSTFNQKLWMYIINNTNQETIDCVLSWMLFETKDTAQTYSVLLNEMCLKSSKHPTNKGLLFLWQISTLYFLIVNGHDPRANISSARDLLEQLNETFILDSSVIILTKCIPLCPSVYLLQLLHLCNEVVRCAETHSIVKQILKSSLLQWIGNPSSLANEAITLASKIFSFLENDGRKKLTSNNCKRFFKNHEYLIDSNSEVFLAFQLQINLETWKTDRDVLDWLDKLEKAPTFFLIKVVNFLFGLFLSDFHDIGINRRVFRLILKCANQARSLPNEVLTVILYKLANTNNSDLHFDLLKAIPKMSVSKDNFQKIISTLQALCKGKSRLKTFSMILMLDLLKMEPKCYPYLEPLLISQRDGYSNEWELLVTKAHVLKELCALKPELYGKDIVAHLSKILNECKGDAGALPCTLAINGITLLCKSEIIDVVTTWATLAPMFSDETRVPVIESLCSLISSIPTLSYTEAYPTLTAEVLIQLWKYTVLNESDVVWKVALNAMTSFNIDQIVSQIPEHYFDEETLNIRKNGHVVPGKCWVQFLSSCGPSRLQDATDFVIKLVSLEISAYLKFVYQVKGTREPVDYSYLPVNSVVRGVSTYIKSKILLWKQDKFKEVYLQCLRIFSQEYTKPLPPLDWCFLQELVHEPEAKLLCISIASHQVVLSGTARRFIVNYVEAVIQNHTDEELVSHIYTNLKYLANSVQPFTLKPFLQVTIYYAVDLFNKGDSKQLGTILTHLKETLGDSEIQESNKVVIADIINNAMSEADISSQLFEALLGCVALLPTHCINDISSPKSVKEIRIGWLKKAVRIRCHLAVCSNNNALNWLNDILEIGGSFPLLTKFMFAQLTIVFEKHKDNTDCVLWFLELIGQIQAKTAEKASNQEVIFLCNVFVLATMVFSGHFVLLKDLAQSDCMHKAFPRAIATLLEVNHWSICITQVLEWFYHMNKVKMFGEEYGNMFLQSLQTLRHESEFHKNMRGIKYLNVACLTDQ